MLTGLDRHEATGRGLAGLDLEHWICFLSQDRLDMADDEPASLVVALDPVEQDVQSCARTLNARGEFSDHRLDRGEAEVDAA